MFNISRYEQIFFISTILQLFLKQRNDKKQNQSSIKQHIVLVNLHRMNFAIKLDEKLKFEFDKCKKRNAQKEINRRKKNFQNPCKKCQKKLYYFSPTFLVTATGNAQ